MSENDRQSAATEHDDEEAPYGRCFLCDTPYESYTRKDGPSSWKIGKTCPNPECDHD